MPDGRAAPRASPDLQAAEFLYETRLFPDVEYTFKHALTHEVAYGSLLQERRRALHARIVEAIERLYPERLGGARRAAGPPRAPRRGVGEGRRVPPPGRGEGDRRDRRTARRSRASSRRWTPCAHLPESRERTEQAIDLHLDANGALVGAGGFGLAASTDHLRVAEALAEALGDARRRGRVLSELAVRVWMAGDPDGALELGQRALAIAISQNDVSLLTSVNHRLGLIRQMSGEYQAAAECLRRAVEELRSDRSLDVVPVSSGPASVLGRLAWCLAEMGEFGEALASSEEAVRDARAVDHPPSLIHGYRSVGLVSLRLGDAQQAIPPLERAVELCRGTPVPILLDVTAGAPRLRVRAIRAPLRGRGSPRGSPRQR